MSENQVPKSENEMVNENISRHKTIESTEQQTQNTKPEIKKMEVHHHPHVEKKNFKEYFLEFLMIFLAVTMGFFAESLREHINDNEKKEQYIQSLTEDLESDTVRMGDIIRFDEKKISELNSMYQCYDTVTNNLKATSCMGVLIKYSKVDRGFQLNDRTLTQLANAGGFRLLGKQDADSIIAYQRLFKMYHDFESTVYQGTQDNVRNTLNELADFRVVAPLMVISATIGNDTGGSILKGPLLFSDNRVLLNKWFNQLSLYVRVMKAQRALLGGLQNEEANLITFYKKKHHLK
jgi:hypothetical protein